MSFELANIIISIVGICLGTLVAYHIYNLSKQQSFRERFTRRETIQKQVEELLYKIRNGNSSKVELINVKKYDTHYPTNNKKDRHGYTYLGAELKGYHFAGVEFFCEIIEAYKTESNNFSKTNKCDQTSTNILMVGVIPYEWIESVDLRGDDTSYRPQFYTYFKGKQKYPYKTFRYYVKNSNGLNSFTEVNLIEQ